MISSPIFAHFCAILIASFIIISGIEGLQHGVGGLLVGSAKWLGGILIWMIIAIFSLPVTLVLRAVGRTIFNRPLTYTLFVGLSFGLLLIPILHPSLHHELSFATHPIGLVFVHSLAGLSGGYVWFSIEHKNEAIT